MEETQLLYGLILPLVLLFFSPNNVLGHDSYKAEASARKEASKQSQKAFEGEISDKTLEAQMIIQNHLQGESLQSRTPCLATLGTQATASDRAGEGCKVIRGEQKPKVNATTPIANTDQLIVCVSFSMPEASLKALFEALDKNPDVKLVMRGLIDDSMNKTARKINDLGGVLEINPELFDHYQITKVPTFVLVKKSGETLKLAGNITLDYARELFNTHASKEKLDLEKTT